MALAANTNIGAIPNPGPNLQALAQTTLALKQAVESLSGQRGPTANRAVTFNDLVSLGVTSSATLGSPTGQSVVQQNATQLAQIETLASAALPLAGGTLTGALLLQGDPTQLLGAATKQYVDHDIAAAITTALVAAASTAANDVATLAANVLPLSGGSLSGPLLLSEDPVRPLEASSKEYVDRAVAAVASTVAEQANALPLAGGTLSGPLILSEDPTQAREAAPKDYVDSTVANSVSAGLAAVLPLAGGTLSGPLILSEEPAQAREAVPKDYVDSTVASAVAAGVLGFTRKFSQTIGDGSTTSIVVTHNLGTQDVTVQVRRATTPFDFVECDRYATSNNTATIGFLQAPSSNQYRVTVTG